MTLYFLEHVLKNSDINEHLHTLYLFASLCKTALEFGVREGESTVALLEGVARNGGRLVSVDINPCSGSRQMISNYGLDKYWTFIQGDDIQVKLNIKPELCFIDTTHLFN